MDVVDGGPQTVEGCDQRIARVRLALRPTVAGDLEGAAVAQDGLGGERGLAQQVADAVGGALRLHQIDDAPSLSAAVGDEVPGVQGYEIAGPQEAAVRFGRTSCRFGCGAWTGSPESRRPSAAFQEEVADNPGRELLLDEIEDVPRLSAGSSRQVAGVAGRLVQETRAGHGVGDVLRFGSRKEIEQGRDYFVVDTSAIVER